VDRDLSELKRTYEADPSDEDAATRYEQALRRAGLREEVDALYQLAFRCPLEWDALAGGPDDEIRACATCARDVHYVRSRVDMARWVAQGECVALDPGVLQESIRVLADLSLTDPARTPGQLCVIEVQPDQAVPSREGLRGGIGTRLPLPMADADFRAVGELLAEADEAEPRGEGS
tara:strand:+ start:93 stop:620 length:528 start_codon:yes stop_codon:yes gene_type:complete